MSGAESEEIKSEATKSKSSSKFSIENILGLNEAKVELVEGKKAIPKR